MSESEPTPDEVPEGAAVFPEIPEELGIQPLLLAVLHATVFLAGSDEHIVNGEAADEALGHIANYMQRLQGEALRRVQEDMACLVAYGKQQKWPKGLIESLRSFLDEMGVDTEQDS